MATSKTSASDLFNRYIWLANTIYSAGRITYEEIASRWRDSHWNSDGSDLPLRTFHDHRRAVEELFDINIECDRSDGFRYYIAEGSDIGQSKLRSWLLSTLSVSNLVSESKDMHGRILLEDIPSGVNFLTDIIEALRSCRRLKMKHRSFWRDDEYDVTLEPYCVKLFKQRWYVMGYDMDRSQIRVYSLDRLVDVRVTGEKFDFPEPFDAEAFFSDYFGVWVDPAVAMETVLLRVEGPRCNYMRSLPLHHSQREVETVEGWSIFEYRIRPTRDFIDELFGMYEYAKVLSPVWLADEVRGRVQKMTECDG